MNNFKKFAGILSTAAIVCLGSGLAMNASAETPAGPSFGTIPEEAYRADGSIDLTLIPDFIVALDRSGKPVGYVTKETIVPGPAANETVFASDGKTVVGQMVPGYGYVPTGASLDEMTPFPVVVGGK